MQIAELLSKYDENFWDFSGVKKEGIHKIGKYPATMVAPMQYELLSLLVSNNKKFQTLLDPFMGSGTSLIEGYNLNLKVFGIDINPYAVLLGEVKTHRYYEDDLFEMNERVTKKLLSSNFVYDIHEFPNIDKWFREDIKESLSKIRKIIIEEENKWIRKFLWICLSEVIYTHSNDRTSTFKLHVKTDEDIATIKNNCIETFGKIMDKNQRLLITANTPDITIFSGDSTNVLRKIDDNSIDIICTSPPYGDNSTTVTYGQASILFLKWIVFEDLLCEESLLSNYSKIDRESLGGKSNDNEFPNIESALEYINRLSEDKKGKVIKFISDYYSVIKQLVRVLSVGGYMLFTVGNRRVDDIIQPLDKITKEIFLQLGLKEEKIFTRNILSKKMPPKVSNVKNKGSVNSMNKETILIFKKGK